MKSESWKQKYLILGGIAPAYVVMMEIAVNYYTIHSSNSDITAFNNNVYL